MAYCDTDDLIARISQSVLISLTDDERLATSDTTLEDAIDSNSSIEDRIDACIADADSEIDSWCRKRYDLPFSTVPARVVRCSASLAIYFLHCRRRSEMGIPDDVKEIWKNEMDWLKAIAKGDADPGVEPPPTASSAVVSDADGEDRAFTADTLEEF